jgi:hypothetical protein
MWGGYPEKVSVVVQSTALCNGISNQRAPPSIGSVKPPIHNCCRVTAEDRVAILCLFSQIRHHASNTGAAGHCRCRTGRQQPTAAAHGSAPAHLLIPPYSEGSQKASTRGYARAGRRVRQSRVQSSPESRQPGTLGKSRITPSLRAIVQVLYPNKVF